MRRGVGKGCAKWADALFTRVDLMCQRQLPIGHCRHSAKAVADKVLDDTLHWKLRGPR